MNTIACEYKELILQVKGVSVRRGETQILRNLDMEIRDLVRPGMTQGQVVGLLGPSGVGKAQPMDAKVLTPTGFVNMGCLQVGDYVIGSDGFPVKVSAIFPQGIKPVYRVTFSDGSETECCDDHLWYTETYLDRQAYCGHGRKGCVKELREIKLSLLDKNGKRNHTIPLVCPVGFTGRKVPIDPYLIGVLLGDGCLAGTTQVRFTNIDAEVLEMVRNVLPEGLQLTPVSSGRCGLIIGFRTRPVGAKEVGAAEAIHS